MTGTPLVPPREEPPPRAIVVLALTLPTVTLLLINGWYLLPAYRLSPALFWSLDLFQFVVVPAVSLIALHRMGVKPADYGFRAVRGDRRRITAVIMFVVVAAAFYLSYRVGEFVSWVLVPRVTWWPTYESVYGLAMPKHGFAALAVLIYVTVTAGFVEETFFRSLPALALRQMLAPTTFRIVYPLLTAVVFSLIHWENGLSEVAATFIVGLAAAGLYMRIGNLWPLVAGHIITDVVAFWN